MEGSNAFGRRSGSGFTQDENDLNDNRMTCDLTNQEEGDLLSEYDAAEKILMYQQ